MTTEQDERLVAAVEKIAQIYIAIRADNLEFQTNAKEAGSNGTDSIMDLVNQTVLAMQGKRKADKEVKGEDNGQQLCGSI